MSYSIKKKSPYFLYMWICYAICLIAFIAAFIVHPNDIRYFFTGSGWILWGLGLLFLWRDYKWQAKNNV